jgi:WD40 repeat protein
MKCFVNRAMLLVFALLMLPAAVRADDIDEYVKLLSDKHPLVRKQAAHALGQMGKEAKKDIIPALRKALTDTDPRVRGAAAEALESLGPPYGEALVIKGHAGSVNSLAFSHDSTRLLCAGGVDREGTMSGEVRLFDPATGKEKAAFRGFTAPVSGVAFSPDGKRFATASKDDVRIWSLGADEDPVRIHDDVGEYTCVAFSQSGELLAFGSDKRNEVYVWDLKKGKEMHTLKHDRAINIRVTAVAFSPDKKTIASAGYDAMRLWDQNTGKAGTTFKFAYSIAFSPDGKRLAAVGGSRTLRIWDVEKNKELLAIANISASSVAWSADGKLLATGGYDGVVRVWAPKSGQELMTFKGHLSAVNAVAFSPDGKRLASGSAYVHPVRETERQLAEVRIWDLPQPKP